MYATSFYLSAHLGIEVEPESGEGVNADSPDCESLGTGILSVSDVFVWAPLEQPTLFPES